MVRLQLRFVYRTHFLWVFYRPQRSWAKVIFSQACVCPRGGVCLSACWDTPPKSRSRHPPGAETPRSRPPEQTPPQSRHPPEVNTPGADTPTTPPREQTPPRAIHLPPRPKADSSIRSTSGRYASYWNAFLFGGKITTF